MKRIFVFIISACILASCSCEKDSVNVPQNADSLRKDSVSDAIPDTVSKVEFDNNLRYKILSISQKEYGKIPSISTPVKDRIQELSCEDNSQGCNDKMEQKKIKPYAGSISRNDDTLKIKCGTKGNFVSIINNKSEADEYCDYRFEHTYSAPNFYLVSASYFQGKKYLIINPKTCEQLEIQGIPIISPDRRLAVAASPNMIPGFGLNTIDFLKFENGKIKVDISVPLKDRGVSEIEWASNSELRMKRTTIKDVTKQSKGVSTNNYARIVIK